MYVCYKFVIRIIWLGVSIETQVIIYYTYVIYTQSTWKLTMRTLSLLIVRFTFLFNAGKYMEARGTRRVKARLSRILFFNLRWCPVARRQVLPWDCQGDRFDSLIKRSKLSLHKNETLGMRVWWTGDLISRFLLYHSEPEGEERACKGEMREIIRSPVTDIIVCVRRW